MAQNQFDEITILTHQDRVRVARGFKYRSVAVNLRAIRASDSRPNEATLMWRFVVLDGVAF